MVEFKVKPALYVNKVNTHIIPVRFEYYEPKTIEKAVELLAKYKGEAKVLAGGTDLLVAMKQRVVEPKVIINIKRIKELRFIEDRGDHLAIGATTTLREIEKNPIIKEKFPALLEAVKAMAGTQIRNMATIGGNLCNASPAADTAPPLIVYESKVKIIGPRGERMVPVEKFFKWVKQTIMEPDELLTEIIIPYHPPNTGSAFIKIARVAMDLAKVNVAVALRIDDSNMIDWVRIALGSVAPTPVRAPSVERALIGREVSLETVDEAAKLVVNDINPITDIRSTAEYRREVSKVIVRDALIRAYNRIKGR